jgi:spermidine synthase
MIAFVVGAASLGTEIAAARLLAPWFGASTIVWANTIATVLVALSVGYAVGGRMADRRPDLSGLCRLVLAAAVLLAIVPFVSTPLLRLSVKALDSISAGAFLGSLAGVLVLVAVPVLLLGAVSPYAVRLRIGTVEEAGRVAGRLYAISTCGSLFGTFLSALVLIPVAGTRRTFLAFALSLALVAVLGLRHRRLAVAPLAIGALMLIPAGTLKADSSGGRVIWESETEYQYARVTQDPGGTRRLELNEGLAVHSILRPGSYLTGDYWDEFLVLPFAAAPRPPDRIAILGNAAGTTARAYGHFFPHTEVDAVEIDGELTKVGRKLFDMRGPRLRTHIADARPFLERSHERYDAILVDAYRQPYIPFYLATREFFELVRAHLEPGGIAMINVGHPEGSHRLERALASTAGRAFRTVLSDPVEPTNSVLVASNGLLSAARLGGARASMPPALRERSGALAARLPVARQGGPVWTDDRAPVEWLIDESIVSYAAGRKP